MKITIIGLGLIGGSLAIDLRKSKFATFKINTEWNGQVNEFHFCSLSFDFHGNESAGLVNRTKLAAPITFVARP